MVFLGDVGRVEARFGTFGDNVSLGTKTCMVGAVHCIGLEIVLDALDGILGDVGRVEARFGTFGDNVSLGTREVHGWRRMLHRLGSSFGCTRWYS